METWCWSFLVVILQWIPHDNMKYGTKNLLILGFQEYQWPTLLGVAWTGAAIAAGDPLGWGTTGAPRAPWWGGRPASLTSPDREDERLSREAWWPTGECVRGSWEEEDNEWNRGRKKRRRDAKYLNVSKQSNNQNTLLPKWTQNSEHAGWCTVPPDSSCDGLNTK